MKFGVFLLFYFVLSLTINCEGICYRPGTATEICCAHFHDVNGICTECPNGTYSDAGESCKDCFYGFYGKRCIGECSCQDNERCNSVLGCVGTVGVSGIVNMSECPRGTVLTRDSVCEVCPKPFYGNDCIYRCTCLQGQICDNVNGCIGSTTTYRFSTTSKGKEDDGKIVLYAGAVGLLVMAILIGMLLNGVKNKYCSQQIVHEQKDDDRHHPTEDPLEMETYEYIDELQMTDQNPGTVPPGLPVPRNVVQHQLNATPENNHRDSVDAQNCIRKEDEGYLNPYQPIQEANIYKHEYKAVGAEIAKYKQIDEYLHPYNSLLKHGMSESHEYKDLRNESIKSELKSSENNKVQSFV